MQTPWDQTGQHEYQNQNQNPYTTLYPLQFTSPTYPFTPTSMSSVSLDQSASATGSGTASGSSSQAFLPPPGLGVGLEFTQSDVGDYSRVGVDGPRKKEEEESEEGDDVYGEQDDSDEKDKKKEGSKGKKPRITLARGGACVACRNRKLKCTGDKPCRTCAKSNIECRYEEIPRKKPRAVMLEERVAELESILGLRPGEPIQNIPPQFSPAASLPPTSPVKGLASLEIKPRPSLGSASTSSASASALSPPAIGNQPMGSTVQAMVNASRAEVPPNSQLELSLIQLILPYTPYILVCLHPQRFLALLSLPFGDSQRPHPALLYILFAECVRILEKNIPPPSPPPPPASLFPQILTPPLPPPPSPQERQYLLSQIQGNGLAFLERARTELDNGIRNVDRPFDLVRAGIAIARHLYSLGRFIEGWNIPVSRLTISCGLHRLSGNIVPPSTSPGGRLDFIPPPYAPAHMYSHSHNRTFTPLGSAQKLPILRMRPIILPPARDEIELAERIGTFWCAKNQDWQSGTGWGWTTAMSDEEVTTQWPWGFGFAEIKHPSLMDVRFGLRDLYDPVSPAQTSMIPESTFVLAIKSMGLLHRSSHLFDLPVSSYPIPHPSGHLPPSHVPPLSACQEVETALHLFRKRIPPRFADPPIPISMSHSHSHSHSNPSPISPSDEEYYDGPSDPWWIMFHANLYTAEMMMWKEMAYHQRGAYETAVTCARALVGLIRRLRPESYIHLDMIVALDMSLASRFLFKEADRLQAANQPQAAAMAAEEAEILRSALGKEYGKWLPMAQLHSLIVQRVREGWPEKEGEYERV